MTELFATYSEAGEPLGLVPRHEVHRRGLWHRAANVFVFNSAGELLLQQRSLSKDVAPNAWDVSAAEHLLPDESYAHAASRGLHEELGIVISPESLIALGPPVPFEHHPSEHVYDREVQQWFATRWQSDQTPRPDPQEVQAVRWTPWLEVQRGPRPDEAWTPWFVAGLRSQAHALEAFLHRA